MTPGIVSSTLSGMDNAAKARENRARRMAERRGFALEKSRRRDPLAVGYGTWTVRDDYGCVVGKRLTLEQVEEVLERRRQ